MVRYLLKAGRKIKLLPAPIPPEEDLHCCICQVKFDTLCNRRACFDLCGHFGCLRCIFKMNDGCDLCSAASRSRNGKLPGDDDDYDLVILDDEDEDEIQEISVLPAPSSLPLSVQTPTTPEASSLPRTPSPQQPVSVPSSVLGRSSEEVDENESAFSELQRLSLSALPILEHISAQWSAQIHEPLVITLSDDEQDEDDDDDIVEVPFDESTSAWDKDTREFSMEELSQLTIIDFSEDEEDEPELEPPPWPRVLRQRRKSQCYNSADEGDILAEWKASEFGKYTCKYCSRRFVQKGDLGRHMTKEHCEIRPYPCYVCDWPFSNQRNLEIHMLIHTDERPFQCSHCDSAYNRQYTLDKHLEKMHGIAKPKRRANGKRVNRVRAASAKQVDIQVECMPSPLEPDVHEEPEPNTTPFPSVNFVDSELDENSQEQEEEHDIIPSPPTSDCSNDEEQKENMMRGLKNHGDHVPSKGALYKNHGNERPSKGDLLKRIYIQGSSPNESSKRRKRRRDRDSKPQHKFPCSHCNKIFHRKTKLASHMRHAHSSDHRPYACDLCGWCFGQKSKLIMHRTTHTVDRPHKCKQCEATFNRKYSLEKHVRAMHAKKPGNSEDVENKPSRKKPSRCPYCNSIFQTKELMAQHMHMRHSDMRPHICQTCQFPFAKLKHLNAHIKCAHGKKDRDRQTEFECAICKSKYNRKLSLECHMESVHEISIRFHADETPKDEEEYYCPECQSLFGTDGCTKVAYSKCGHISCMECVKRAELGCGQCTTENARRSWSPEPQSPSAELVSQPLFIRGQFERSSYEDEVLIDVEEDDVILDEEQDDVILDLEKDAEVEVDVGKEQYINFEESLKISNVHETEETVEKTLTKSNGTRTYFCTYCKEPFSQKMDLGLHLQHDHGNLRPHPCDICHWPFSSSKDLERHRIIHTNDRPFRCNLCPVTFNRKSTRDRHVEKIHLKWRRI